MNSWKKKGKKDIYALWWNSVLVKNYFRRAFAHCFQKIRPLFISLSFKLRISERIVQNHFSQQYWGKAIMTSLICFFMLLALAMTVATTVLDAKVASKGSCKSKTLPYSKKCARKGASCYSGWGVNEGCRKWLACRVSKIANGLVWDDGVDGTCTRRPKRTRLCKKGCVRMGQYCYIEKMSEREITDISVPFSWRYYTTCRCYQKCIGKVFQNRTPSPSPKVKQTSIYCNCDEDWGSTQLMGIFRTCSLRQWSSHPVSRPLRRLNNIL